MDNWQCYIVIPVLNERGSIGKVIQEIPFIPGVDLYVIVVDNGSDDGTDKEAGKFGAHVLYQPRKGYGSACLKGISYINTIVKDPDKSILCILDGDYSDYPEDLSKLCAPIIKGEKDLVIGARTLGEASNSLTLPQKWGNRLAVYLMKRKYDYEFADMGPFRVIHWPAFKKLNMGDQGYGWNVEMQVKAVKQRLRIKEVSVRYRKRIGRSKISGTIKGVFNAGIIILRSIYKYG